MITPHTSYSDLASAIGVPELYFKREDTHPYGSHKGRSIPHMIDVYVAQGDRAFAISSSGNAALAAALHIHMLNEKDQASPISLDIYVGHRIAPHKKERLDALATEHIRILTKENPLQALHQATQEGLRSLRQSTDDVALEGYVTLAQELLTIPHLGSIFIGTSSGTTAQALSNYFLKHAPKVQVHIVQTSSCHPLSDAFESSDAPDELSIAEAISDRTAHRKNVLVPLIEQTGGRGWIATNDNIRSAQEFSEKYARLSISTNSALSVAGLMKAVEIGYELPGAVVCVICGE